ncbi:CTF18 protein, partial [Calcarius ornatus]|nr:CTF18 protein [Calcarius ornatus]
RRQVQEASQRLTEIINSEPGTESPDPSMDTAPAAQEEPASHCLWVDKFTPQRYMELLSDDVSCWDRGGLGVGGVMLWDQELPDLNLWDSGMLWDQELPLEALAGGCVCAALPGSSPGSLGAWGGSFALDTGGSPVPVSPGSDDRSPEVFQTRIEAATQMRSVLGSHERPNCLIIDEIDGAPAASINVLLAIIQRGGGEGEAGAGRRRRREGGGGGRPIICICNDQ